MIWSENQPLLEIMKPGSRALFDIRAVYSQESHPCLPENVYKFKSFSIISLASIIYSDPRTHCLVFRIAYALLR